MHTTEASPDATQTSIAAVLDDAARYIDTYGWCQGGFHEPVPGTFPRACALGAIHAAAFKPATAFDAEDYRAYDYAKHPEPAHRAQRAIGYLADFLDHGVWRDDETPSEVVWEFNDHPDTTQDLVTDTLRQAAARARTEQADRAVT